MEMFEKVYTARRKPVSRVTYGKVIPVTQVSDGGFTSHPSPLNSFVGSYAYMDIVVRGYRKVEDRLYVSNDPNSMEAMAILKIGVKSSVAGKGVERKMVKKAEDIARERGLTVLVLEDLASPLDTISHELGFEKTETGYAIKMLD
jgi:predicted GNAT family acetyltransferase